MADGAECHAHDCQLVPAERANQPATRRIPDPHGLVPADRGEHRPVGAVGHPPADVGVMSAKVVDQPSGRRVPDLRRPILTGRGERLAVGAEGHVEDIVGVAAERQERRMALPLQVVPFPAAQVGRAAVEQPLGTARILRQAFAVRQGDIAEVELQFQLVGLLGLPATGDSLAAGEPLKPDGRQRGTDRHGRQHHQRARSGDSPPSGCGGTTARSAPPAPARAPGSAGPPRTAASPPPRPPPSGTAAAGSRPSPWR